MNPNSPQDQPEKTEVRETKTPDGDVRRTTTTTESQPSTSAPGPVVAQRVVYYIGGAIMLLLALRLVLALLGANRGNPFADFVFDLSAVFASPFFSLFNYQPAYGVSTLELGTLVAIIVYGILTIGIAKLFTLSSR